MPYSTINNLICDKNKCVHPVQMILTKWNSAYGYAHLGPNTKFVSDEKQKEISYIVEYEIFTTMDVGRRPLGRKENTEET